MNQPRPNAGRRGHTWQHRVRPLILAAARGICAICGTARCPHCGKAACGGTTPPGQVDHLYSPLTHPHLAEDPTACRAAHGCCNRLRGQPTLRSTSRVW